MFMFSLRRHSYISYIGTHLGAILKSRFMFASMLVWILDPRPNKKANIKEWINQNSGPCFARSCVRVRKNEKSFNLQIERVSVLSMCVRTLYSYHTRYDTAHM